MFELTPGERRGALVLLLLVMIGSAWDLTHREPGMAPPLIERPRAAAQTPGQAGALPVTNGGAAATAAARVDLNHATAAQLDALPGIGPVLAGRIAEYRSHHGPFANADELLAVRGIGPRLLERLRPCVSVERAGRTVGADTLHFARPARR